MMNFLHELWHTRFVYTLDRLLCSSPNREPFSTHPNYSTHRSATVFTSISHQQFLAQSGGTVVWAHHGQNDSARHLSLGARTGTPHRCVACKLERHAQTVRLEGHRRRYPRQGAPL